jgi:hypothetical protein
MNNRRNDCSTTNARLEQHVTSADDKRATDPLHDKGHAWQSGPQGNQRAGGGSKGGGSSCLCN